MVQIIKAGKIKHVEVCRECGCEFKFEAEDVTKRVVWDDHGGHYPAADFLEIRCPFCKEKLDLCHDKFNDNEIKQMDVVND